MITPRESFSKSPFAKGWLDLCDSKQFEAAAQAALLEMQLRFRNTTDAGTTVACQKKMEGAIQFLEILTGLTLPPAPSRAASKNENLEHNL